MWGLLVYFAVWLRTQLHLPWIRCNRRLGATLRRPKPQACKVLVMGDGLAEGVGDWVTMLRQAGLQGRLAQRLDKARVPAVVRVAGCLGATSEDWLPTSTAGPSMRGCCASRVPLWKKHFGGRAPPDVVVLMVGAMDSARHSRVPGAAESAANISAITRELVAMGALVCVCLSPPSSRGYRERNTAVIAAVIALQEQVGRKVALGPSVASLRDKANVCFDGHHLSSTGYGVMAKQLATALSPLIVSAGYVSAQSM